MPFPLLKNLSHTLMFFFSISAELYEKKDEKGHKLAKKIQKKPSIEIFFSGGGRRGRYGWLALHIQFLCQPRHQAAKHEGVRYPCDMCDYMATQKTSLKKHKEAKHEKAGTSIFHSEPINPDN